MKPVMDEIMRSFTPLCLPSKAELQAKLLEWTAEVGV